MSDLLAIDVAILPPPEIAARAVALSAGLAGAGSEGPRLDGEHLPHLTLTQQFVRADELEQVLARVDDVLRREPPPRATVTGAAQSGHSIWLAVERSSALLGLHERLMEALRGLERPGGTPAAFVDGDARVADVLWVAGYRLKSSFGAFTPHITLGHGDTPPDAEPMAFDATTVAVCHLGRFCTCRRVLREWTLSAGR